MQCVFSCVRVSRYWQCLDRYFMYSNVFSILILVSIGTQLLHCNCVFRSINFCNLIYMYIYLKKPFNATNVNFLIVSWLMFQKTPEGKPPSNFALFFSPYLIQQLFFVTDFLFKFCFLSKEQHWLYTWTKLPRKLSYCVIVAIAATRPWHK